MSMANPYKLNTSAKTPADQLESTRALEWELRNVWTGVLGDFSGAFTYALKKFYADPTRVHVDWAARCRGGPPTCNVAVRALMAQMDLVASALLLEPVVITNKDADTLPRMALLRGMSKSMDILSWTSNPTMMVQGLSKAIRTDPSVLVRLEALRAIGLAPIPASWVPILLDAIQRAEAVLAQTPFTQVERQTLAKYLADVTGKLQSSLIQMPATPPPAGQAPQPPIMVTTGVVNLPDPLRRPWQRAALVGVVVLGTAGGVALALRRSEGSRPIAGAGEREGLRIKIGTLAHNRAFSRRDLLEYGGTEGDLEWLKKQGYIRKAPGGWYPSHAGWSWIEG